MSSFLWHTRLLTAFLWIGGALSLASCGDKETPADEESTQNMMTQQSENLTIIQSKNGKVGYRFTTPLMERYELAREPFSEFRKGVRIETYNDSTGLTETTLTANYSIWLEKQDLWEAKGNVKAVNAKGEQLETEQLFWDRKAKRVYSNVDTKVTREDLVVYGEGFESDDEFKDYKMRKTRGSVVVDTEPRKADSSAAAIPQPRVTPETDDASHPVIREGEAVAKPKREPSRASGKPVLEREKTETETPRRLDLLK